VARCLLNEGLNSDKNKYSHLLCFKNVSEIIKSKNNDDQLIATKNYFYVFAVSMAEMNESKKIREQYLKNLEDIGEYPLFISSQRNIFLHFDRKKFIYHLQQ